MRGDSNDMAVFYGIGSVMCLLVMVLMLGIILKNWILISTPLTIFSLLILLGFALYKRWPIPFLKR